MTGAVGEPELVVSVRLFAALRQSAGRAHVELRLPAGATVADALGALEQQAPLRELMTRMPMRMAVNREYATPETRLSGGDELALIPPVSGGEELRPAGHPHVRVTGEPLSLERLARVVSDARAGAVVVFEGVTRELASLDYEAYAEMAEERIERILRECVDAHGLCSAAAEHRVGTVPLGEPSVIVAVSAAHRAQAFAGAREAIDRIKAEAPIWKREQLDAGTRRWVEGSPPPLKGGIAGER